MRKWKITFLVMAITAFSGGAYVSYSSMKMEAAIDAHRKRVEMLASAAASLKYDPSKAVSLPAPVQRYFKYVFKKQQAPVSFVQMTMRGDFRRPGTQGFKPTTAEQTLAAGVPAFVFSATTPILTNLVWARVYDAFADAKMEMIAKLMSTLTVLDQKGSPELNRISLRRWLLESVLCPSSLLPGGLVRWEPLDTKRARAIVSADGIQTSMIATFRDDGSLARFDAEQDGDLTTPYHGSGERVERGDYRLVSGVMIPHSFTISRVANGQAYPFWKGRITSIRCVTTKQAGI